MFKFHNEIINGDCLKELKKFQKFFDLVFADPPYNLQTGEKLTRPDASKVNGVNDKWISLTVNDCDVFVKHGLLR